MKAKEMRKSRPKVKSHKKMLRPKTKLTDVFKKQIMNQQAEALQGPLEY
jgi:hypothetical protein